MTNETTEHSQAHDRMEKIGELANEMYAAVMKRATEENLSPANVVDCLTVTLGLAIAVHAIPGKEKQATQGASMVLDRFVSGLVSKGRPSDKSTEAS